MSGHHDIQRGNPTAPHACTAHKPLTDKQQVVFDLLCRGYTYAQIAHEIGKTEANVFSHIKAIKKKLGARTNANAVFIYMSERIDRVEAFNALKKDAGDQER